MTEDEGRTAQQIVTAQGRKSSEERQVMLGKHQEIQF